jgi:hypothetical protein
VPLSFPKRCLRLALGSIVGLGLTACGKPSMPDPRDAAKRYAEALEKGDHAAVYALLTQNSKRRFGTSGTRKLMDGARAELLAQARAASSPSARMQAEAELRFEDGDSVVLVLEDDAFKVGSAGTFPAEPRTPAQALSALRRALAVRSYPALVRLLSAEGRGAVEGDLRALVEGLDHSETLEVEVDGDSARVAVPGGYVIKLRREFGVWRIEDIQ